MFRTFESIDIGAHLLKENSIGVSSDHKHVFNFESTSDLSFQHIGDSSAFCLSGIFFLRQVRIDRFFLSASKCQNRSKGDCCKTDQK